MMAKADNPAAFLRLDQASPRITWSTRFNSRNASVRVSKRQPRSTLQQHHDRIEAFFGITRDIMPLQKSFSEQNGSKVRSF